MANKNNPPSVKETAFDCPHCGAYTTQTWHDVFAKVRGGEHRVPVLHSPAHLERIREDKDMPDNIKRGILEWFEKATSGFVLLYEKDEDLYAARTVINLHLSECFNCKDFAVWIRDRLVFPLAGEAPSPNEDLPVAVRRDYEEASKIVNVSPRGSAALLRLAIQKLCAELGEKGKKIDDDIATLVKKGLSPMVQQALDAVRVIGNESVHPGTLDLKDDKETASELFLLVNIIAEQMISNPKHVKEVYEKLPASTRRAIEERDAKEEGKK